MTDREVEEFYDKLVKEYGDKLPNPEHYPRVFRYYVELYRHVERSSNSASE